MIRLPLRALGAFIVPALVVVGMPAVAAPPQGPRPASAPSKGDVVPVFETMGIDGQPQKVEFPEGSKTVLLFFLSSCPSCHKMIPEWNRAYERRPEGLTVLGVIMDQEPPGFWSTRSIAFPVVRAPGRQFLRGLNVNRAPLTLRVIGGGTVEDLALGVTDPIRLGELFKP
jgi:thiol-disulfide isomerase/thioredoxin